MSKSPHPDLEYARPSAPEDDRRIAADYPPPYSVEPPQEHVPVPRHKIPNQPAITHNQQPQMITGINQPVRVVTVIPPPPAGRLHVFSAAPVETTCPKCHQRIITKVQYESGCCMGLSIGLCLLCGCWLGCCLIPLCVRDCKDAIHSCPNCNGYIATYQHL